MKKILYTSGDELSYWETTKPRLEAYAAKVGAELVVLPKRTDDNPQWVIFDAMADLAKRKEKDAVGAWVDADVIVGSHAVDVFAFGRFMVCEPYSPARVNPKWQAAVGGGGREFGVPNMRPYPVTGLCSFQKAEAKKISDWFQAGVKEKRFPGKGIKKNWWGDQEVLALAFWELNIAFFYFASNVHRMQGVKGRKKLIPCQFAHAAGNTARPEIKERRLVRLNSVMENWEKGLPAKKKAAKKKVAKKKAAKKKAK